MNKGRWMRVRSAITGLELLGLIGESWMRHRHRCDSRPRRAAETKQRDL